MRVKILVLVTLVLLATSFVNLSMGASPATSPLAIGFGTHDRYVLYFNGSIYSLSTWELVGVFDLPNEIKTYVVDFEVLPNAIYLYAYRSINGSAGETLIIAYNVSDSTRLLYRRYEFYVENGTKVIGAMVLSAIASVKGLAVMIMNSTHTIIEVYRMTPGGLGLTSIYDGRMAMSIYRHGESLISVTYALRQVNATPQIVPLVVDLIENRTVFELPALIPVATLAQPYIQVFKRNESWECYVVVYNPTRKIVEYYVVYPGRLDLIECPRVIVSSTMDYAIMEHDVGSKVLLKDGRNITIPYRLSLIPQGFFMPLEPLSGVMDVDVEKGTVLAKIVENGVARLMYIQDGSIKRLIELEASVASKARGFYGAIAQNMVYIMSPLDESIVSINVNALATQDISILQILVAALLSILTIIVVAVLLVKRRVRRSILLHLR